MQNRKIQRRVLPNGIAITDNLLLDRIYRSRGITQITELDYSFQSMLPPQQMSNLDAAVTLLLDAYQKQQRIVIVGDFDADGATSLALMLSVLRHFGFQHLNYIVPDRFEQGYGLSISVAQQAVEQGVDLLITVDNGISSFEGIAYLKERTVKVLVTDHHLPSAELPNADVIVNPNLVDCPFPSKALAGVGVTFYLLLALRAKFRELNYFPHNHYPNLADWLDIVALGTVADVVPLDHNNRTLVYQGMRRIQVGRCCYGIKALAEVAKRDIAQLTTADLSFAIAPRLNAAGRLDNMAIGVELLLADNMQTARALALELDSLNQERKNIEQGMKYEAMQICQKITALQTEVPAAIALYQADWHQGVLGIVAARIKEHYYRPVIAFAKESEGTLKGSARSIAGIHIRDLLERIDSRHPNLILKFGGHAMAAGLSINETNFKLFCQIFAETTEQWMDGKPLVNEILSDGELKPEQLTLATAELLQQAGPWGQHFPEPIFDGEFTVLQQRLVGEKHLKMLVESRNGGALLDAIYFNIDPRLYPDLSIKTARLVYKLDINEYQGQRQVQLLVNHLEPLR